MKTTLLALSIILLLVSCKKDYNCICMGDNTDYTTYFTVTKASKHAAARECANSLKDPSIMREGYNRCTLK